MSELCPCSHRPEISNQVHLLISKTLLLHRFYSYFFSYFPKNGLGEIWHQQTCFYLFGFFLLCAAFVVLLCVATAGTLAYLWPQQPCMCWCVFHTITHWTGLWLSILVVNISKHKRTRWEPSAIDNMDLVS